MIRLKGNPINPNDILEFPNDKTVTTGKLEKERFYFLSVEGIMPDRYVISTYGRIFDLIEHNQLEISYRNRVGRVRVYKDAKIPNFMFERSVNRLMAITMIPKTKDDKKHNRNIVHVKNFDITDHRICNLMWVNSVELSIYNDCVKYDKCSEKDNARYICRLLQANYTIGEIIKFGKTLPNEFDRGQILNVKYRREWSEISKDYKF